MPVATFAVLRTQDTALVEAVGFPVLLANTYHLLLRPGTDVFRACGGIHPFMNWKRSVLTDSGGYQIFSLAHSTKISEEGALFKSYVDGKKFLFDPELSIETQKAIGSDIMMVLDQCVPSKSDETVCREAVDITARWAERSLAARGDSQQAIFGIVQGACDQGLRITSARQITSLPFDGYAIGGLAVGESDDERKDITEMTAGLLPRDHPRYLMGVGTPLDLLEAVHRGVDMFDCIIPTSLGQQGVAFTSRGVIELRRGVHKLSNRPLDEACACPACSRYTRAYLHHLIKTKEYFGQNLVGLHNLYFYSSLMRSMRDHIVSGDFASYYREQKTALQMIDEENPPAPPIRKNRKELNRIGEYEVVRQKAGFHSIKHTVSGEIMHSVTEPLEEARELYVKQARLRHELSKGDLPDFVIWDVGLGAATNAMATLFAYEEFLTVGIPPRGVKIVSFERDLDSLRLAVKNASFFPHVHHAAPSGILRNGSWSAANGSFEWVLYEGDFLQMMETAPLPDCIYYDPFSLHTDAPLWGFDTFRRIFALCGGRPVKLFTYSASTQVRSVLLAAGFYVGKGAGIGPKSETTIACTSVDEGDSSIELLGSDWLERFKRSDSKVGGLSPLEEHDEIIKRVLEHPQFERAG
jgi:queuine tRNA-ribosyltransferase